MFQFWQKAGPKIWNGTCGGLDWHDIKKYAEGQKV